jgi:hypothetical protein
LVTAPEQGTGVPARPSTLRVVAIGCFMAWIGGFSGAMVGVLISKGAAFVTKAPSCDGIPTCNWYVYAAVGAAIGALTLPWLVVGALRRPPADASSTPDDKF